MQIDLEAALRLADRSEVQSGGNVAVYQLGAAVRGLVERVRECPAWHQRPTGPGVWICEPDEIRRKAGMSSVILDLDQEALDEGAPHFCCRVFGPVPGCSVPVYPECMKG